MTIKNDKNIKKNKKVEFLKLLEDKLIDLGTKALKTGITNFAISQIDDTEEKIKKVLDKKFKFYKNKTIEIISYLIAFSFISYGILDLILSSINYGKFTNLIFGIVFLIIALYLNNSNYYEKK